MLDVLTTETDFLDEFNRCRADASQLSAEQRSPSSCQREVELSHAGTQIREEMQIPQKVEIFYF